ncbi:MAG: hypothetical protein M1815_006018 [Lichina confinis]|nr:MAG: hypothetical protein M1815_006018 [Lichina confinis]
MAAFVSGLNAKIRSHPVLSYVCSTHFWGPVSNFGIPVAAVMDTQKDPQIAIFMRYSVAVSPKNYLLFGCHFVNECAQLTQGYRFLHYWKWGGRERALAQPSTPGGTAAAKVDQALATGTQKIQDKGREAIDAATASIKK